MHKLKEKEDTIHIALGFDNNYIVPIYALFTSIFHNNKKNKLIFHVVATGINHKEKSKLSKFVQANKGEIRYYDLSEDVVTSQVVIPPNTHFTIATYYRVFFPSLIKEDIKKLLYIDSDTIVIGDLKELYNIDTGNFPIAASPDSAAEVRIDLGIYTVEDYFNAGVLLIDIKKWKEEQVTENVLQFLMDHPDKVKYVDQDALNATLKNRWLKISKKYNFTLGDVRLRIPAKLLIKGVVIVHYTSYRKPWNFLTRNKLRYLYHYYLKLSPKAHEKKYIDVQWDKKSLWTFFRIRMKEFYFDKRINEILPIQKWINSPDLEY